MSGVSRRFASIQIDKYRMHGDERALLIDSVANWLDRHVQPDVYAVAPLRRSLSGVSGTRSLYHRAACKFLSDLNSACREKCARPVERDSDWVLPGFMTLLSVNRQPQLNILLRRPEAITPEA